MTAAASALAMAELWCPGQCQVISRRRDMESLRHALCGSARKAHGLQGARELSVRLSLRKDTE